MKLVLALDDSEFAEPTLSSVLTRPWPEQTEILVISVAPQSTAMVFADQTAEQLAAEAQLAVAANYENVVANAVARLRKQFPQYQVYGDVIVGGNVRDRIVQAAQEFEADLIVVGSHGRTPVARFLLGSVADAIMHRAPCSVEVIKPQRISKSQQQEEASSAASAR
jgi:nucleotide-binding universal stress UspA family protein